MSDDEKIVTDEDEIVATDDISDDVSEEALDVVADEDVSETEESADEMPKSEAQKKHEERLARHASKHSAQEKHAARQERHAESKKDKKSDSGKRRFGLWRWIKAIFLELKKVTWPSFPKVVKTTAVVLGIVLFFLAVLAVMDMTLGFLYGRMMDNVFD